MAFKYYTPQSRLTACLCLGFVCSQLGGSFSQNLQAKETLSLEDVIANVASNEALYDNVELVVRKQYELARPTQGARDSLVLREESHRRLVYQKGMTFVSVDRTGSTVGLRPIEHALAAGYDGRDTRIYKDHVANIHPGDSKIPVRFFPHTLLMEGARLQEIALSEYLSRTKTRRGSDVSIVIDGFEALNTVSCVRLRVEIGSNDSKSRDFRYLWLAPDRNYLPAKTVAYAVAYSQEIPLEESSVTSWQEVEPGIWCAKTYEINVNYETAAGRGELVRSNQSTFRVEKADLHPDYSIELFRNIKMPDGTVVFNIAANNEISRGSIVGAPSNSPTARGAKGWLIILNLIAVPVVFAVMFIFYRRKRRVALTGR